MSSVRPQEMKFSVHEINQAASGGSYVCIFDAEVKLKSASGISVAVERVDPPETDNEYISAACEGVRTGAVHVLEPLGMGAEIRITRLVVNFVDFKQNRFTLYTARELKRIVDEGQ